MIALLPLATAAYAVVAAGSTYYSSQYSHYPDVNCEIGHGAIVIDTKNFTIKTIPECEAFCDATPACHCVVMTTAATSSTPGYCWRR